MKKIAFIIFAFCSMCVNPVCAETFYLMVGISPYEDPQSVSYPVPRVPAQQPTINVTDHNVSFPAFGSDCTLEIVDVTTEEVLHREPIVAGTTTAILPATLEGEYIIRFVFQTYMFWGYISL